MEVNNKKLNTVLFLEFVATAYLAKAEQCRFLIGFLHKLNSFKNHNYGSILLFSNGYIFGIQALDLHIEQVKKNFTQLF